MKLGIIVGVLLGIAVIAIAAAVVVVAVVFPLTRQVLSSETLPPDLALTTTPLASGAPGTLPVAPAAPANPTAPSTPAAGGKVSFTLNVTDFTVNGFSGDITAQVTDNGTADAHNLQARIQAVSAGSLLQINNSNNYAISLGTLKAGQTIPVKTTLDFTIFDGFKINSNGATIYLWLISDEKTQTFSYNYHP